MKKEYIILGIFIIAAGLYIFFRQDNQVNYTLPTVQPVTAKEIDRITITGTDKTPVSLKKAKDGWTIGDREFPADAIAVTNILDQLEQFRLLALVSEKKDLDRYELSPGAGICVTAWAKDKKIRNLTIGKAAPSFNHTFVMLENTPPIYQAKGNLRPVFSKSIHELRSKQVLKFSPSSITSVTLSTKGRTKTFTASTEENDALVWKDTAGKAPAHAKALETMLSTLSDLRCESFLDEPGKDIQKNSRPVLTISLKDKKEDRKESREIVLEIFTEKSPFKTVSSMNQDGFIMFQYLAEEIQSQVYDLLGMKKKAPKTDKGSTSEP